jgi:HAD superfamily hydrolase (TIGR01509 family)
VIFDMDGVLMDSEQLWNQSKQEVVRETGGHWREDAPHAMMGMSSREHLPLLPGAVDLVHTLQRRWPLAVASSANREIIDFALDAAGLAGDFRATISSEEVERGKPAPDVYLEAARRLDVDASRCVAIEDSGNGIRSAAAAGMAVIAMPNQHYPPDQDALDLAAAIVHGLPEITPELVERLR